MSWILSRVMVASLNLMLLLIASFSCVPCLSLGQDKYDFKHTDYQNDTGEGLRIADKLIKSAEQEKIGAQKIVRIRIIDSDLASGKYYYQKYLTRDSSIGKPAPKFSAKAIIHNGKSVKGELKLDDFKNKVILLDFWNVNCKPCIAGFPHLTELETKYGKQGLVIIGVTPFKKLKWSETLSAPIQDDLATVDQELEALVKFAKKHKATHRLLILAENQQEQLSEKIGATANPFAFLIDRKGVVRKSARGSTQIEARDFEKMIEKLLDEN